MLDKHYLSPCEARERLLACVAGRPLRNEEVPLLEGFGRVLASDVHAPEDLPAFDRSTVDGFAVSCRDTFGAGDLSPAYLTLKGEVSMGVEPSFTLSPGCAARIPTGGMLPEGADAVVMIENAHIVSQDMIEVTRPVAYFENVIRKGEDVARGEKVLGKGRRLLPQDVGALAGLGIATVHVFAQPAVAIIATGDEIVPIDRPVSYGQVRDINSYTLAGLVTRQGAVPHLMGIVRDSYEEISRAMREALDQADIVLISGGTSAGVMDMTSQVIDDAGSPGVLFHGVALKPGKPTIGGCIGTTPVLGLPGHPAAVAVSFSLFVGPLISVLSGLGSERSYPRSVKALMAKAVPSAAGREDHVRVAVDHTDGAVYAVPVLGKSGLITTLVKADGTVVIPPERLGLDVEEEVTVLLF